MAEPDVADSSPHSSQPAEQTPDLTAARPPDPQPPGSRPPDPRPPDPRPPDSRPPGSRPPDPRPPDPRPPSAPRQLRGVITDWGGVLTNPLTETVYAWLEAEGIDRDSYRTVMRAWVAQAYDAAHNTNPIRALERGECTVAEFEQQLAAQLVRTDGGMVPPEGLLAKMFAGSVADEVMHDLIRAARQAGLRTALLSNSWGDHSYPRHLFPEFFDAVVISSEVGMRKPEERIFRLATELIGLDPAECVFIDDIQENVDAAQAAGLVGVRHRTAAQTTAQLTELLGISL